METQQLLTPDVNTQMELEARAQLVASRRHNVRLFRAALAGMLLFSAFAMFVLAQYHHSGLYVDVSSPAERRLATPIARALLRAAPSVRRLRAL